MVMGQLERYGLYVLCVVIFLILGVALWGDDPDLNRATQSPPAQVAALEAKEPAAEEKAAPKSNPQPEVRNERADKGRGAADALRQQFAAPAEGALDLDGPLQAGKPGETPKPRTTPADADAKKAEVKPEVKPVEPVARASEYVIQAGDNLESIAAAKLGSARAWREIEKANPGLDPRGLKVGAKIKLPAKQQPATAQANVTKPVGADEYEVRAGDTLEKIAKLKLGKETRWRDIQAANPGLNPSRLQPGARIKLPAKATEVSSNR